MDMIMVNGVAIECHAEADRYTEWNGMESNRME